MPKRAIVNLNIDSSLNYFNFSCEKTFILTGITLPNPSPDRIERQVQLKEVVVAILMKLDPALACHKITYVRVIKAPKPSILEVECETTER